MKRTTTSFLLFVLLGLGANAQPFSIDSTFVSHFDFRSQNLVTISNIYETILGDIVISGNFNFTNGTTPHGGVVSYNRNGNLNANFVGNAVSGRSGIFHPINDSTYYLANSNTGSLVDSLGQEVDSLWRNNFTSSVPCGTGVSFFYPDRSGLVFNNTNQFQQNPCDVYLASDTFSGNHLVKIQPNGLWDSTFNVTMSGRPSGIKEYDSNRLFLYGYPFIFTQYEGQAVKGLCRIFKNGQLDPSFQSPIKDTTAQASFTIQKIDSDGSIFLIGRFYLTGYSQQFTIVKLLPNGSLDPNFMNFSGPTDSRQIANGVSALVKTKDGGYLVGGTFDTYQGNSIRNLAKIDSLGNVENQYFQGLGPDSSSGNGLFFSTVYTITKSKFGGYYIGGDFLRHNGLPSQPIYRIYDSGNWVGLKDQNLEVFELNVYPNPSSGEFTLDTKKQISGTIYNNQGKFIKEVYSSKFNLSEFPQGIYFLKVDDMSVKLLKR